MDDSVLQTEAKEGDFFCIGEQGNRYLVRIEEQSTPIRFYNKDTVFLKYYKGCPLFRDYVAQTNKDIVQFLLDCSEKRDKLTCKNMFKYLSKNKVKGINGHNSCHDCDHFYEGLFPRWESYVQSLSLSNKTDSNPELKHSSQSNPD